VVFTKTLIPLELPVTISNFPSPFISFTANVLASPLTANKEPAFNADVEIEPVLDISFKWTRTLFEPALTRSTFPSLLKSPARIILSPFTPAIELNSILLPKFEPVISLGEIDEFVTLKKLLVNAINPLVLTDIEACVELAGTVTVKLVVVAAVTVAFALPKYTILFAGVASKFVPVIVTLAPTSALAGLKLVIVGTCANDDRLKTTKETKSSNFLIGYILNKCNYQFYWAK